MKRSLLVGLTMALGLWATGAQAGVPAPTTVNVIDTRFQPKVASQTLGASVNWEWNGTAVENTEQPHNVRQDKRLFFSGAPTTDGIKAFSRNLSAGTFPYHCTVHGNSGGVGMSGRVEVKPLLDGFNADGTFDVVWATAASQTGDEYDVRFRVGDGDWRLWKNNTSQESGRFGRNGRPVTVKPNRTYRFQARSQKSANRTKRSGWSPTLRVSTTL